MDAINEQAVKERAYALWIEAGMVHGMDRVHWLAAETAMTPVAQPAKPIASAAIKSATIRSTAAEATTEAIAAKSVAAKSVAAKSVAAKSAAAKKGGRTMGAPVEAAKSAGKVVAEVAGKSRVSTRASSDARSHPAN